jgi:uncharacterized metal-binding protein YceD (DUF177 family)
MSFLKINLRQLEQKNLSLSGKVSAEELGIENIDELIRITEPVQVDLEVQLIDKSLCQGGITVTLACECSRCLKPFADVLNLSPYDLLVALDGEEAVKADNDSVDLTPFLREDILLGFPQHPLCETDCGGLARKPSVEANQSKNAGETKDEPSSVWTELNKLKF